MATKQTTAAPAAVATEETTAALAAVVTVTYVDKEYASRSLFLGSGRPLAITRGRISVPADDAEARAYLDQRADFERLTLAG